MIRSFILGALAALAFASAAFAQADGPIAGTDQNYGKAAMFGTFGNDVGPQSLANRFSWQLDSQVGQNWVADGVEVAAGAGGVTMVYSASPVAGTNNKVTYGFNNSLSTANNGNLIIIAGAATGGPDANHGANGSLIGYLCNITGSNNGRDGFLYTDASCVTPLYVGNTAGVSGAQSAHGTNNQAAIIASIKLSSQSGVHIKSRPGTYLTQGLTAGFVMDAASLNAACSCTAFKYQARIDGDGKDTAQFIIVGDNVKGFQVKAQYGALTGMKVISGVQQPASAGQNSVGIWQVTGTAAPSYWNLRDLWIVGFARDVDGDSQGCFSCVRKDWRLQDWSDTNVWTPSGTGTGDDDGPIYASSAVAGGVNYGIELNGEIQGVLSQLNIEHTVIRNAAIRTNVSNVRVGAVNIEGNYYPRPQTFEGVISSTGRAAWFGTVVESMPSFGGFQVASISNDSATHATVTLTSPFYGAGPLSVQPFAVGDSLYLTGSNDGWASGAKSVTAVSAAAPWTVSYTDAGATTGVNATLVPGEMFINAAISTASTSAFPLVYMAGGAESVTIDKYIPLAINRMGVSSIRPGQTPFVANAQSGGVPVNVGFLVINQIAHQGRNGGLQPTSIPGLAYQITAATTAEVWLARPHHLNVGNIECMTGTNVPSTINTCGAVTAVNDPFTFSFTIPSTTTGTQTTLASTVIASQALQTPVTRQITDVGLGAHDYGIASLVGAAAWNVLENANVRVISNVNTYATASTPVHVCTAVGSGAVTPTNQPCAAIIGDTLYYNVTSTTANGPTSDAKLSVSVVEDGRSAASAYVTPSGSLQTAARLGDLFDFRVELPQKDSTGTNVPIAANTVSLLATPLLGARAGDPAVCGWDSALDAYLVQSQTHAPSNDNYDVDVYNIDPTNPHTPAANRFATCRLLRFGS